MNDKLRHLAGLIAGSPHNLVARGDRERVYERHVLECLEVAKHLPIAAGHRWIDVGTGGGLPGLVLAATFPDAHFVLVDSVRKKAAAVEAFARELGLSNVDVLAERAETLAHRPDFRVRFDGAISRAVAALPTLIEWLAGFVRPQGLVVAIKGPRWEEELAAAHGAMRALRLRQECALGIPTAVRPTVVVMMRRHGALPSALPRRVGTPRTTPLGGS